MGGSLVGSGEVRIRDVCALDEPQPDAISFVSERSPAAVTSTCKESGAGALLIRSGINLTESPAVPCIAVDDPQRAMLRLLPLFRPAPAYPPSISEKADIAPSAKLGRGIHVGAFSVIGEDVVLEDRVIVHPHVTIYRGAIIKAGAVIHSGAVIREYCIVGEDVVIQNGAVIGADGFGYIPNSDGSLQAVPQVGNVELGDKVEVGANSCIDRGALGSTRVGSGTKIDNQVQVGHNVKLGKHCILCGQTGIAGSCQIGDHVIMGARTGVRDHAVIAAGSRLAAGTQAYSDLKERGDYGGSPAVPHGAYKRNMQVLKHLAEVIAELKLSLRKEDEKNK